MTTTERYAEILHKRHGWIAAPPGSYFAPSKSGKTIEYYEPDGPGPNTYYPFGTTFHARSIYAMTLLWKPIVDRRL